ncbi:MAG: hypothetical protein AB7E32_04165 [Desulfovibrio sp.]
MQIYHFDQQNVEYLGASLARPNPLEHGTFLIPANATMVNPPDTAAGRVACWNGTAWVQVEDHRGVAYWLPGDEWDAPARIMEDLGPLPDEALLAAPEKPASVQAEERRAEILVALAALDTAAIRPTRAILAAQLAGSEPDAADTARLAELETQAQALRTELAGLEG